MKTVKFESGNTQHQSPSNQSPVPKDSARVSAGDSCWDIGLIDCEFLAATFPETFKRHPKLFMEKLVEGMLIKVVIEWPIADLPTERPWVEVTSVERRSSGGLLYFGELRNRTLLADWGEKIGPILPRNVCDIDFEKFLNDRGTTVKEVINREKLNYE